MFLAVWVVGMYVMWGWPTTREKYHTFQMGSPSGFVGTLHAEDAFGVSRWLLRETRETETDYRFTSFERDPLQIAPRGLAAALIMTIVSSLILYIAWRAAVHAFTCAAGTCDACGYDLTGLAQPRCPECGMEIPN